MAKQILVTGAAGFIGSTFVRVAQEKRYKVTVLDSLTYAGHLENLTEPLAQGSLEFIQGDIRDFELLDSLFSKKEFTGIINFAAESHVDNSISGPRVFVETNVVGTLNLLEVARKYWSGGGDRDRRFLQVSTDEVFGALGDVGQFSESTPYRPNSPYSASKAGADHLVRAWFHTYGLPTVTTNCSNNYGPRQYPEKLIPVMIQNALLGRPLPVYGKGLNVRDWIHVEDHSRGVLLAFEKGRAGESYCFGGNSERTNLQLVQSLCSIMDELAPRQDGQKHKNGIQFVQDRAGHDFRYAIDDSRARSELGFVRKFADFEQGLRQTVEWYIQNQAWVRAVQKKNARH